MRICLVTPYYRLTGRGNTVSSQRLVAGLRGRGVHVDVCALDSDNPGLDAVADADIVHGLHAYRSGRALLRTVKPAQPLIISYTGTDLNHDLTHSWRRRVVEAVSRRADALVVYHEAGLKRVAECLPEVAGKTTIIQPAPQVRVTGRRSFRRELGLSSDDFVFLLPAGIRKVKNVRFAVEPLACLHSEHPEVKLLFAGPIIEEAEGERLKADLAGLNWARYLGEIDHALIGDLLFESDVVLNTSHSEGLANTILESMYLGRPVLASDIEGNRSVIRHDVTGLLYSSETHFLEAARELVQDAPRRRRLGEAAKREMHREFSLEKEIDGYLNLYQSLRKDTPEHTMCCGG